MKKAVHRSPSFAHAALMAGVAVASLVAAAPAARANVGVTAAVNVDARGTPPGAAPRVLTLGQSVIFNEQITTDNAGLVQILLLDGTTFTVGPNSRMTIDEFVYNPATGDAKVVASLTKGAFRFVGAKTSQAEGGATVRTPVGTIGIRGAVANFTVGENGETTASLVAGKSLTITDSDGTTRIVYENGYTAVISKNDRGGTTTTIRKSTAAEIAVFQQQMVGGSGTTGGNTGVPPGEQNFVQGGVSDVGSGYLPDEMPPPPLKPVESSTIETVEESVGEIDDAAQDETRQEVVQQEQEPPPPPPPPPPPSGPTQNARVLTSPLVYTTFEGLEVTMAGSRGLLGSTAETDRIIAFAKSNGRLVAAAAGIDLPDLTGGQGDGGLAAITGSGTSPYGPVSGTAYAGRGDFVTYLYGIYGDPTQPFYVIYGTPTDEAALLAVDSGTDIREYTLTQDPIRQTPLPFFADDLYGPVSNYNASNFIIVEGAVGEDNIRALQTSVSIEGSGPTQRSAVLVITSWVYPGENGQYQFDSARRGSMRHDALQGPTSLRGGVSTLEGATGGHFFGSNAEHFVVGQSLGELNDGYADVASGPYYTGNPADGYLGNGYPVATHHVGSLASETPQSSYSRTSRTVVGFINGMAENALDGPGSPYVLADDSSDGVTTNFSLSTDATYNQVAASGTLIDTQDQNSVVAGMLLGFGSLEGEGASTFVDDDRFAAVQPDDRQLTRLLTDTGGDIPNSEQYNAGSYLVSGRANPIPGYQHCTACDFVDWGWWGTRNETPANAAQGVDDYREDFVHMGTWVAGDITDPDDLPQGGYAEYSGTALGTVARDMGGGQVAKYIASGTMEMGFDFGERQGTFGINGFDGMNVSGTINGEVTSTQSLFSGGVSGGAITGNVSGAFVNDGIANPAAGVIGGFTLGGDGISAVGTVVGGQTNFFPPI